ncbi:hypothetical protein GCM10027445_35170 [Amycolatopsis endophytica]|uniref:Eis-like acetyltransferase domain-containing protein n=1 Tax=Amycolatopsis endophytica TaxID=860233 RepID=A0A853BBC0_9PSEU|nr:hypothetical protein [Amycolatopsis endophytica]NYI92075.1 hypothetical protein [Amycolatopsis endophytica]
MSGFVIRPLAAGEERAAFEVLGRSLHAVVTDEFWSRRAASFPAERRFGAFAGPDTVGVAGSFATRSPCRAGKRFPWPGAAHRPRRVPLRRPGQRQRRILGDEARERLIGEHQVAVHTGPRGDDGFVLYRADEQRSFDQPDLGAALLVRDLHARDTAALAGLWRFLLRIDLVAEVRAPGRPLDDPLPLLLTDPRACAVTGLTDHTWLRLVDVPAALAARAYGPVRNRTCG